MKMKHSECNRLNNTAKGLPMFEKMKVNFFFQSDVNKKGGLLNSKIRSMKQVELWLRAT